MGFRENLGFFMPSSYATQQVYWLSSWQENAVEREFSKGHAFIPCLRQKKSTLLGVGRETITSFELKLKLKFGKCLIGKDFLMPVPFDIKKAYRKSVLVYKLNLAEFLE